MNKVKSSQNILVVDDAQSSLLIMESILASTGARVFLANNAEDARKVLQQHDLAVIFLDIIMPDISGYDLAEEIHNSARARYVPIILMTAQNIGNEDLQKGYKHGVVDILTKPLIPEIILHKTNVFLQLDNQKSIIKEQQKDLKSAFKRLQDFARHDQLTGLFNREQITNMLARLVGRGKTRAQKLAVMFLDLDHFKVVNDSYGHAAGDLLLRSIALRLKQCVRDSDYVARLGGDEFCIVLNDLESPNTTSQIAMRILEDLSKPHNINSHEILTSTSIGIAVYDGTQTSASKLLKNADAAMYLAKNKGRSQYAYFSEELEQDARMRIELGTKLKNAIINDQLETYFQPQYSATTDQIVGLEALMRWRIDGQFISPVLFISIAEERGFINELGLWILNDACHKLKDWQTRKVLPPSVTISVNISSRQLQFDGFLESLRSTIADSRIEPECLELELTESAVMSDPEHCVQIFRQVHQLGCKISVDDFGTGYSSLSYLSSLPLDAIKIDRSFVNDIITDGVNQTIVKAIIALSHNLGLKVVAEGVETEEQLNFLKDNRCDVMQGYLLSRPVPADELESIALNG